MTGCALLVRAARADAASVEADPIRVGVVQAPAFVTAVPGQPGEYAGFSADLFKSVAQRLGRPVRVTELPDLAALLESVERGGVDVAVSDLLITADRQAKLEFSYPITDGGLRVLVHSEPKHSLAQLWRILVDRGHLDVLAGGALLVAVVSVLLIGVWRRLDAGFPEKRHDAFAESLYRTVSLTVSGKTKVTDNPKHAVAKIGAAVWLAVGAGVVAYVTASFSSAMTAEMTQRSVNTVADLAGKSIGAIKGSVAERYCQTHGLEARPYETVDALSAAMLKGDITAVIGDGPALEAYDRAHPELPVTVVGPLFEKCKYGFAMPIGSPLRREVDGALLRLEESGETAAIYARYFSGA